MVFQGLPPMQRAWVEGDLAKGKAQRSWEIRPVGKGRRPPSAEGSFPNIAKLLLASVYPFPPLPPSGAVGRHSRDCGSPVGQTTSALTAVTGARGC